MGKFNEWICKIEGKEPYKKPKSGFFSPLPRVVYYQEVFASLIEEVLETGVGEYISNVHYVNEAFEWSSHEDEDVWRDMDDDGYVTQHIYDVCLSWSEQELADDPSF